MMLADCTTQFTTLYEEDLKFFELIREVIYYVKLPVSLVE